MLVACCSCCNIKEFRVWDSYDFSYWILETWTWSAWYKINFDKEAPDDVNSLFYQYEKPDNEWWCFYNLGQRLGAISLIDWDYAEILFEAYDAPENPIMSYRYVDSDHWKLSVYYPDKDVPWAKEDIEAIVSKKDLFEAFYVWFIKQIIKYYDWVDWVFENDGCFWSKESNLYNFFNKRIDNYLRAHWVEDIDELVQKAKDKIKADLWRVYEKRDEIYNTPKYNEY